MGETLIVLLVALMLFGTKRLPGIARNMGRALEEFRRAARDITQEVMHAGEDGAEPEQPRAALPGRDRPDESVRRGEDASSQVDEPGEAAPADKEPDA